MFLNGSEYESFMASPAIQQMIKGLDKAGDAGYEKEISDALTLGASAAILGYREKSRNCLAVGTVVATIGILVNELRKRI